MPRQRVHGKKKKEEGPFFLGKPSNGLSQAMGGQAWVEVSSVLAVSAVSLYSDWLFPDLDYNAVVIRLKFLGF